MPVVRFLNSKVGYSWLGNLTRSNNWGFSTGFLQNLILFIMQCLHGQLISNGQRIPTLFESTSCYNMR